MYYVIACFCSRDFQFQLNDWLKMVAQYRVSEVGVKELISIVSANCRLYRLRKRKYATTLNIWDVRYSRRSEYATSEARCFLVFSQHVWRNIRSYTCIESFKATKRKLRCKVDTFSIAYIWRECSLGIPGIVRTDDMCSFQLKLLYLFKIWLEEEDNAL